MSLSDGAKYEVIIQWSCHDYRRLAWPLSISRQMTAVQHTIIWWHQPLSQLPCQ